MAAGRKKRLWVANFQYKDREGIRTLACCVEAENILGALHEAKDLIFIDEMKNRKNGGSFITDIGIADEQARDYLGTIYSDPISDPDPDLFQKATT